MTLFFIQISIFSHQSHLNDFSKTFSCLGTYEHTFTNLYNLKLGKNLTSLSDYYCFFGSLSNSISKPILEKILILQLRKNFLQYSFE